MRQQAEAWQGPAGSGVDSGVDSPRPAPHAGISRQYLLPMPSGRKKFEEPTFQPAINPHSKVGGSARSFIHSYSFY